MKKQDNSLRSAASARGAASLAALKVAGQERDLERQRQGTLQGADVAKGMIAIAKRAKVLAY